MSLNPRERLRAVVKTSGVVPVAVQLGCSTTWVYSLISEGSSKTPSVKLAKKLEAIYAIPWTEWYSAKSAAA